MSKIRREGAIALTLTLTLLSACAAGRVAAQADVSFETAQDALVDLGRLFQRATGGAPLATQLVNTYLAGAEMRPAPAPTSVPTGGSLGGHDLLLAPAPAPTSSGAGSVSPMLLPVRPVSPENAREIYRRQAFLALYLQKHGAVLEVLRSGKVPLAQQMSADEVALHGRQAVAARVELFLIERIALGEGETQAAKCAAFQRADVQARALGFGRSDARVTDADTLATWRPLFATASAHHTATHAREARIMTTLCAEGAERSRSEVRAQLEAQLDARLQANIDDYFGDQAIALQTVQERFTELSNASAVLIPRAEIAALEKGVTDAKSVYDLVGNDTYGLAQRLDRLKQATARALAQLEGDAVPQNAFATELRELAQLQGELAKFLALARSLGAIGFVAARDRQALGPCARLPSELPPVTADADLAAQIDACLASATALRARLSATPDVSPEREAFMRHLSSLSTAYLTVNRW